MRYEYPDHHEMVASYLTHYEASDGSGADWYDRVREQAAELGRTYEKDTRTVAGIIAALSPQVQWSRNLRLAENVLRDGDTAGQTRNNTLKAWRVWLGEEPDEVLSGPKVTAFFRALCGDDDAAVIDTWMTHALDWPNRHAPKGRQYERVAAALVEAAGWAGLAVAPFQATVWTHVRGGGE